MRCPGAEVPPDNLASIATVPFRKRTMAESREGSMRDNMCKFVRIQGFAGYER
jgi:hypothetical protein